MNDTEKNTKTDEHDTREQYFDETPSPEALAAGERKERARVREVRGICKLFPETSHLESLAVDEGWTVEQTRKTCLETLQASRPMLGTAQRVEFGEDSRDKFTRAATNGLRLRVGHKLTEREAGDVAQFTSLLSLAEACVKRAGIRLPFVDRGVIIEAALGKRAFSHSTSDYPNILSNVANKSLLLGWTESPATWRPLVRVVSAPDFKTMYRYRLGDSGALELTPELAPMPEGSVPENAESYAIATYSKRFGCSRQMLINDDLSAFDRIPYAQGAAARRLVGDLFYALLVSAAGVGPAMAEDSEPLFSASHTSGANYTTGAFAISVDNLGAAKKLMRRQKGHVATGETAPYLNIAPAYLLVPTALENLALQITTQVTPATAANVTPTWIPNLQVLAEPRLDDATNGTTAWYLVASPSSADGAEVAFLDGREEPQTVRVEGTNVLGIEWGVYLDVGVKFTNHRGWYRAKGA